MKNYDLTTPEINGKKICIVFSTKPISPIKFLKDIENEHQAELKDVTEVYFDFLLSSHNSKKRYAKMKCENGTFVTSTFAYISVPKQSFIRKISTDYYKSHSNSFDWTCVSSIKKKLINNGIII